MVFPSFRFLLTFCVLVAAGLLGNILSIPLFYGVDLVFGSIAALVAVRLLGVGCGAAAAALMRPTPSSYGGMHTHLCSSRWKLSG